MGRAKYITDEEIDFLTNAIYNDALSFDDESLSEVVVSHFNEEVLKELLIEGEQWVPLEGFKDHYVITNYSRILNTKTGKVLKTMFSRKQNFYNMNYDRVQALKEFERIGWRYDREEVLNRFEERGWNYEFIPTLRQG